MSQSDPKKKENKREIWKDQIHNFLVQEVFLTSEQKFTLENVLINERSSSLQTRLFSFFQKLITQFLQYKKVIFSHSVTALVTAGLALCFFSYYYENMRIHHDFINEIALLPNPEVMPADFDLVGDSDALPSLSEESLENKEFQPVIPKQISQNYAAYEGRFFQMKGSQGVSISMEPHHSNLHPVVPQSFLKKRGDQESILYIVKLSTKNESSFPREKTIRKIQSSLGKIKRIYAWRDGAYGYAMVREQSSVDGVKNNDAASFEPALLK